jgi:hypothetical protein
LNLGLTFFTPEEFFSDESVPPVLPIANFDPREYPSANLPLFSPTNTPIVSAQGTEVVIFVGLPVCKYH